MYPSSAKPRRPLKAALKSIASIALCSVLLAGCSKPDYKTADGSTGDFKDLRGKWLVINYWAEWCKPCIEELPELTAFQREYENSVTVLTVNYDGALGDALRQQIEKLRVELPVLLLDPAAQLGYKRPDALPTTLIITPEGELKDTLIGPQTVATLAAAMGPTESPQP